MSIIPLTPSLFAWGRATWVKSQWKLRAYPGHFSVEINRQALHREKTMTLPYSFMFSIPFAMLGANPTLAQSFEGNIGLTIGVPSPGAVDLGDFGAIIAGVESSPNNTDWVILPVVKGMRR
jgi:hypothetical protein